MIRSFESNRGRERRRRRGEYIYSRHTFADVANWIFFLFILEDLSSRVKKKERDAMLRLNNIVQNEFE
jgi:hypothetical protein